jgi:hypothetical protein
MPLWKVLGSRLAVVGVGYAIAPASGVDGACRGHCDLGGWGDNALMDWRCLDWLPPALAGLILALAAFAGLNFASALILAAGALPVGAALERILKTAMRHEDKT